MMKHDGVDLACPVSARRTAPGRGAPGRLGPRGGWRRACRPVLGSTRAVGWAGGAFSAGRLVDSGGGVGGAVRAGLRWLDLAVAVVPFVPVGRLTQAVRLVGLS